MGLGNQEHNTWKIARNKRICGECPKERKWTTGAIIEKPSLRGMMLGRSYLVNDTIDQCEEGGKEGLGTSVERVHVLLCWGERGRKSSEAEKVV